jgi:hypothetical protein
MSKSNHIKYQVEHFYLEFDPRTVVDVADLIDQALHICKTEHGKYFNQFEIEIGRLNDNAELYFLKAEIVLPVGHENRNLLK